MSITATLVKQLREKTGVGLMACKNALAKTNGDIDKATTYLREKGLATASKKAERSTNEGRIFIKQDGAEAIILELNCETDFVANNNDFKALGETISTALLNNPAIATTDDISKLHIDSKDYTSYLAEFVLKLGENLSIKRFQRFTDVAYLSQYSHMNGKIGVVVCFSKKLDDTIAKDIAMQVAATNPQYLHPQEIPQDELDKESHIIKTQAKNEGRPEQVIEKIVQGKLSKFYKDSCLLEQAFIKDDKKSVKQLLPSDVSIIRFTRYGLQ